MIERLESLQARRSELATRRAEEQRLAIAEMELKLTQARRPWILGAASALTAGLFASVTLGFRANKARLDAERQTARADQINAFVNQDLLSGLDVATVGENGTVSMRELLQRASDRAALRFEGQPYTEALVRGQLGRIYARLALPGPAADEFRRALGLVDAQTARADEPVLKIRFEWVESLANSAQVPLAKAEQGKADADADALGAESRRNLEFVRTAARFAVLYQTEQYRAAQEPGLKLVELSDGMGTERLDRGFNARFNLGDNCLRLGEYEKAEALFEALRRPPYDSKDIGGVRPARVRINLARVKMALAKTQGLEESLLAARDAIQRRLGPNDYFVAAANAELGNLYMERGDFEKAAAALRAAHQAFALSPGIDHPSTRIIGLNLSIVDLNLGHNAKALERLDDHRTWFIAKMGGPQGAVAQAIDFERVRALNGLARANEALTIVATLNPIRLAEATPGRDWEWRVQAERGRALLGAGDRAEGLEALRGALAKMETSGTADWIVAGYRKLLVS